MIEITIATIEDSKEISELMLQDLQNPNPKFSKEMIYGFREHAKEKNIKKEFENPKLILFMAKKAEKMVGFIVGYENALKKDVMIHYITANKIVIKKELLNRFIQECRLKNFKKIITDAFEFMENNEFFKSNGFILTKKEKMTADLEVLWYELNLN